MPTITLKRQCALVGVSRATVYAQRLPKALDEHDPLLLGLIDEAYTRHPFYGSRKMVVYLGKCGHSVIRKRVQRLIAGQFARAMQGIRLKPSGGTSEQC